MPSRTWWELFKVRALVLFSEEQFLPPRGSPAFFLSSLQRALWRDGEKVPLPMETWRGKHFFEGFWGVLLCVIEFSLNDFSLSFIRRLLGPESEGKNLRNFSKERSALRLHSQNYEMAIVAELSCTMHSTQLTCVYNHTRTYTLHFTSYSNTQRAKDLYEIFTKISCWIS